MRRNELALLPLLITESSDEFDVSAHVKSSQ
jgi:hypothetical protein